MMERNSQDNIEQSKVAYKPENAISDEIVLWHLGNRASLLLAVEIQKVKKELKKVFLIFAAMKLF